jgi:two-component system, LytTR family, response regulator
MNCVIIDDEASAINVLNRYVSQTPDLNLLGTFQDSVEALSFVNNNPVELIYLDINMPNLNGISFLELLQNKCKVILTTAYSEYALESYKYDVIDYLLKPISFDKFLKATMKAIKAQKQLDAIIESKTPTIEEFIMVQTEAKGKYKKINFANIIYVEALLNYAAIVTAQGEKVIMHISMKELESRLPSQHFVRIHKSFIVALNQIKYLAAGDVVLLDETIRLPMGVTFKEKLYQILEGKFVG